MLGKKETRERRRGEKRKAGATVSLGLPDFSRWILPQGADGCFFLPSCCTFQKSLGEMGREYLYVSEVAAGLAGDFSENFNQCINTMPKTGAPRQTEPICPSADFARPQSVPSTELCWPECGWVCTGWNQLRRLWKREWALAGTWEYDPSKSWFFWPVDRLWWGV